MPVHVNIVLIQGIPGLRGEKGESGRPGTKVKLRHTVSPHNEWGSFNRSQFTQKLSLHGLRTVEGTVCNSFSFLKYIYTGSPR